MAGEANRIVWKLAMSDGQVKVVDKHYVLSPSTEVSVGRLRAYALRTT